MSLSEVSFDQMFPVTPNLEDMSHTTKPRRRPPHSTLLRLIKGNMATAARTPMTIPSFPFVFGRPNRQHKRPYLPVGGSKSGPGYQVSSNLLALTEASFSAP